MLVATLNEMQAAMVYAYLAMCIKGYVISDEGCTSPVQHSAVRTKQIVEAAEAHLTRKGLLASFRVIRTSTQPCSHKIQFDGMVDCEEAQV